MKISDYIVTFLERKGVTCVFELSGGMIAHLLDSFGQFKKIQVVSMHHEQGAAFAAKARQRGIIFQNHIRLKYLFQISGNRRPFPTSEVMRV